MTEKSVKISPEFLIFAEKTAENFRVMKSAFGKKIQTVIFAGTLGIFCAPFLCAETNHVVQKGETLYSISKKYNVTVQALAEANKIDGTGIKTGQKLVIPEKQASATAASSVDSKKTEQASTKLQNYTVKKGDTWYAIARAFSVNVKTLYELNGTDGTQGLKAGQTVKVPASSSTSAASSAVATAKTDSKTGEKAGTGTSAAASSLPAPIVDTHKYSSKKGDPNLVWPVQKPEVTYVNGKVSGVTLSAKKDESVEAIKSGTVMFSGSYRGFGNVVFIQSKTGHIYAYTGLGKVLVSKGEYIDFKTQIGTAGIDSYTSKSQISLMVFQNGLPIDPAKAPRG